MAYDLSTYRGDAVSFAVTLSLSGAPLNLDDYLAFFTVKKKLTDPDSKAVIRKNSGVIPGLFPNSDSGGITIIDAAAGSLSIDLYHADTKDLLGGIYYYGISAVKKSDDKLVYTLREASLTVSLDVGTRRTSDPT
tara:strand:- start:203 stop:607 length:405 start_codon:yes stop_codon:yes gene_type:complete